MKKQTTDRGFGYYEFKDSYGNECSLQESSSDTPRIWLGVNNPEPKILASKAPQYGIETEETTGWIPFPIPEDVLLTTRMHLNRAQVKKLLPILQKFAETGEI